MDRLNDSEPDRPLIRDDPDRSLSALTDEQRANAAAKAERLVAATLESENDPTRRR